MKIHGRRTGLFLALAGALCVPLCLPGSALAAHDLRIYKVEKQVDLNSDYNEDYVECLDGDYALDGMWRIDHVDYDEDMAFADLMTTTDVLKAERDAADVGRYNFAFTKNALGRTQLKLFATCLGMTTEQESSHTHAFVVSGVKVASPADLAAASNINNVDVTIDDFAVDEDPNVGGAQACKPSEVVIAPGWHVSRTGGGDVADQWGRITGSTLFGAMVLPKGTANRNSWQWRFRVNDNAADPVDLTVSAYCLRIKVVSPGVGGGNVNSKHKLIVKRNRDWTASLPGNAITERQLHCKDHYKALVAGWWLQNPDFTWYMGMDPRPKTRAYRFLNSHGTSEDVDLAALCFNYRTT